MTPAEWAEVFHAGARSRFSNSDSPAQALSYALITMEEKCQDIAKRQQDRPDPIAILPPTVIEGGQRVGRPSD